MGFRVVLTGPVQTELIAPYFRSAGYEVANPDVSLDEFKPDYVYDVASHDEVLAAEVANFRDARMQKLSGCPYSLDGIRAIVDEFSWEVLRSPRKVLAVDADNTLWKGILSEDGPRALVPFREFQEGLKRLAEEGVVLVLLTKNDSLASVPPETFTIQPFLSAAKVNWEPKPGNLLEVCRELNLSPDSVVFVDDNAQERALMAAHLGEVAIAPFPRDLSTPKQFLRRLGEYFFSDSGKTAEDRIRVRDYRANALREKYLSKGGYLDALELSVEPSVARADDLERLVQMAGKTNQFNATTRRLVREDFERIMQEANKRIWVFRTCDKFGEQGLVCYVILDLATGHVTDFVMSCRAMGRTLEHFVYDFVRRQLGREPTVDFVPTAKNRPFLEFRAQLPNIGATHYHQKGSCSCTHSF